MTMINIDHQHHQHHSSTQPLAVFEICLIKSDILNHNKFIGKSIFMSIINKSIPCCWLILLPVTQNEMSLYLLPTEQKTLFHAPLKRKLPLAFAGNYNPIFRDLP